MEEKIAFGKYISEKRKAKGLTQKALAEQLYISESAVSKWERGKSYPDITLVTSICQLLDITEHELITASDDENQRQLVKEAKTLKQLIQGYHLFWGGVYGTILIGCLLGDLLSDGKMSWFFIVLGSVLIGASLISVPVLVKENKSGWTLLSFTISLILMYGICNVYFQQTWFFIAVSATLLSESILLMPSIIRKQNKMPMIKRHKAITSYLLDSILLFILVFFICLQTDSIDTLWTSVYPSVLFALLYGGGLIGIIRYTPFNTFIRWGLSLLLSGFYMMMANPILTYLIDGDSSLLIRHVNTPLNTMLEQMDLNGLIGIILIALSILFLIAGSLLSVKQYTQHQLVEEKDIVNIKDEIEGPKED